MLNQLYWEICRVLFPKYYNNILDLKRLYLDRISHGGLSKPDRIRMADRPFSVRQELYNARIDWETLKNDPRIFANLVKQWFNKHKNAKIEIQGKDVLVKIEEGGEVRNILFKNDLKSRIGFSRLVRNLIKG